MTKQMSRNEALERIEFMVRHICPEANASNIGDCYECLRYPCNDMKALLVLRDLTEEERPHGEWIPCSERLPEESGQYYVSGGDKVWICSFLIIPTFKGGWCNNVSNPVVEAWMPLPEPYKIEGEAGSH